jgi:hypothetical protein
LRAIAVLEWYIPGRLTGHRFLYSPRHEQEFARDAKQDVLPGPLDLASGTVSKKEGR